MPPENTEHRALAASTLAGWAGHNAKPQYDQAHAVAFFKTHHQLPRPAVSRCGGPRFTMAVATVFMMLAVGGSFLTLHSGNLASIPSSVGSIVAWGRGDAGQTSVPAGLSEVVAIAAGHQHNLALKADGTLVAWGSNGSDQTNVPAGLSGVVAIAAGDYFNLALKANGKVVAWGNNSYSQADVPADLSGVVAIAGYHHSLALKTNGTVVAWGNNNLGQADVPTDLSGVVAIAAGGAHSLALKTNGTVVAWGRYGQTDVPAGLSQVAAISAGLDYNLALKTDGTVVAWGNNNAAPVNVPADLSGVVAIDAGGIHALALKTNGTVVAWGENGYGQTSGPVGLSNVGAIAAGFEHSVAVIRLLYPIRVSASPAAGGTIAGGGNFSRDASQAVTATANSGYVFVNWTENGSQVSTLSNYPFTVNSSRTLVANFIEVIKVRLSASPPYGGTVSGGGNYYSGTTVTVVATEGIGSSFLNWTEGGAVVSGSPTYTFKVDANKTLVANFDAYSSQIIFQDSDGLLASWFMKGTDRIAASFLSPDRVTDPGVRVVGTADFNQDQQTDLLLQDQEGNLTVWFMEGTARSSTSPLTPNNPGDVQWRVVGTGDFNGDAKTDLLFQHEDGSLAIWLMDGTQRVTPSLVSQSQSDAGWIACGAADFNGDGKDDLLMIGRARKLAVWFMDGTNRVETKAFSPDDPVDPSWKVIRPMDLDGDHKPDLLVQGVDGLLSVRLLDGTRTIAEQSLNPSDPNGPWRIIGRDITRDLQPPTISVSASPALGGTVSGGGTYLSGTSVTLLATAASGYNFANWTENDTPVSASANYTFTARGNRTLAANFIPVYAIDVSALPTLGGTVSGGGAYLSGASVTLLATVASGYNFVNWTEGGTPVSTSANYTFTANGNRTLAANFTLVYWIDVSTSPTVGGTVSGGGTYISGANVTLLATTASGYSFVNWTEAGAPVSTTANYTFTANGNRTLAANFAPLYKIVVSASPTIGGTVSGGGTYASGTSVTLLATAASGYSFVNWTENGAVASRSSSYTLTVNANRTLVANFDSKSAEIFFQDIGGFLGVWFMDGPNRTAAKFLSPGRVTDLDIEVVGIGDFNQDRQTDLLFQDQDGNLTVWFMEGTARSSISLLTPGNPGDSKWRVVGTGDFDGDAKTDLLFQHEDGRLATWLMDGTQRVTPSLVSQSESDAGWIACGAADFNGDGKDDLLMAGPGRRLAVWMMDGASRVATKLFTPDDPVDPSWNAIHPMDLDGDHKADLLIQRIDGSLIVRFLDGTKTTAEQPLNPTDPTGTWRIIGRDFNKDLPQPVISLNASPAVGGTLSGGGSYRSGASVTVTATAASGYNFVNWTEGGTPVNTSANYTFTANTDRALSANFSLAAPVLRFEINNSNASEGDSNIKLKVLKIGSGAASVGYAATGGNAEPGRDYRLEQGRLDFGQDDTSKEVIVTLLNDFVLDGEKQLIIALNLPSGGGKLGVPDTSTILIADDEKPLTPTSFAKLTPPDPRTAIGGIKIHLEPGEAINAAWRLPWELFWHASDETLRNLDDGSYPIQFRPIANYLDPPAPPDGISVSSTGSDPITERTFVYRRDDAARPAGSLVVRLGPPEVFLAASLTSPGWKLRGDTAFLTNNQRVINLPVGSDSILEFQVVKDWIAPPARLVTVLANVDNVVHAEYVPAPKVPDGTRLPTPVPTYQEIEDSVKETLGRPLSLMGQLKSAAGYGSGIAVRKKVVLTAAHVLFDENTTNFVTEIDWHHELHAGAYDPRPIRALGWAVFDQYLVQRRAERDQGIPPGVATLESRKWDVAAIYFDQDIARHGESGFLLSDATDNEWLVGVTGPRDSFLGGYPLTGPNNGRLHVVESRKYRFVHESGPLYSSSGFLSYPGNSGGPFCVLADLVNNPSYYPAAVYLGDFDGRSVVRAIDRDIADLINRADSSAKLGTNFSDPGVTVIISGLGSEAFGVQKLTIRLQPKEAIDAGAGWRIIEQGGTFTTSAEASTDLTTGVNYTVEFARLPGWVAPSNLSVKLPAGQSVELAVAYELPPVLTAAGTGLFVSGPTGRSAEIEFTPVLGPQAVWTKLQTVVLSATPIRVIGPPWTAGSAGYYRAKLQP